MKCRCLVVTGLLALAGLLLSGCGSNPTGPSAAGVRLRGVAMGSASGVAPAEGVQAQSNRTASGRGSSVVVTVQENPSLSTTISANGTFELEGLPAGTFTLVFSSNGVTLGTVTITSVPDKAEIELVVHISSTSVVMVTVKVNGTDETDDQKAKSCLIEGGTMGSPIELEGSIAKVDSPTSFDMQVNGQRASGPVTVDASSAAFDCAGVMGTCDATLIAEHARVHVSGSLTSCSPTAAEVKATQVKFQH